LGIISTHLELWMSLWNL